jgi:hypothetical protein
MCSQKACSKLVLQVVTMLLFYQVATRLSLTACWQIASLSCWQVVGTALLYKLVCCRFVTTCVFLRTQRNLQICMAIISITHFISNNIYRLVYHFWLDYVLLSCLFLSINVWLWKSENILQIWWTKKIRELRYFKITCRKVTEKINKLRYILINSKVSEEWKIYGKMFLSPPLANAILQFKIQV